ncbi:hypothetical protein [Glutamicibacter ardleyensis]|uniref:hypothetical protein n=1 Tax=Glutamicibacter ardleyensis TaxID=225894 RepID=UPI003FD40977
MNEEELLEALVPVRGYFTAKEVTRGTVLAAYLRREGLKPTGDSWMTAQAALGAGMSFEEAVGFAIKISSSDDESEGPSAYGRSLRSSAIIRQSAQGRIHDDQSNHKEMDQPADSRSCRTSIESDGSLPRFRWFAKRTTAGDMDGEGLQRLLGAPGHDNLSVLVRETAQNSWDARRVGESPNLTYILKRAEPDVISWLRSSFQTPKDAQAGLRIQESLDRPGLRLLEISDRGTTGLGGPTRNDIKIPEDIPHDFVNLVLNIGVPRDVDKGGGTYGFGKIASYRASRCRTAIIWTRCIAETGPEHRLIAVSLGPSFDLHGRMHTGHHWWGRIATQESEADRVEPLTGGDAEQIGALLFSTPFRDDFGTSILIIDPDVEDEESGKLRREELADIIRTQLWPKILPDHTNHVPMPIRLNIDGEDFSLNFPELDRPYAAFGKALNAIRAVQSGQSATSFVRQGVEIHEIWSQRPKFLLGHLAISTFVRAPSDKAELISALPVNSICLMRHAAELVVKYEGYSALPEPDVDWCAVFKPTVVTDDAFAESEPPAHDDWLPDSLDNRQHKIIVNVSKRERRNKISSFLQPLSPPNESRNGNTPTGELANALSWLVPQESKINEKRIPNKKAMAKRRKHSSRKAGTVTVLKQERMLSPDMGFVEVTLVIKLEEDPGVIRAVEAHATAKTEIGNESTDKISVDWLVNSSGDSNVGQMVGGELAEVKIRFPEYLLAEISFNVRAEANV